MFPTLYFFDEEIARFELQGRYGLFDHTDLWFFLPIQNHTGGFLDPLIEDFHRIGFEQYGRDLVMQNQVTLAVAHNGKVTFFSDERIVGKTQDPVLGITQRLLQTPDWMVSGTFSLKPPLTHTYDVYQSGWDQSYGITALWRAAERHVFYFGGAFIHRPTGAQTTPPSASGMGSASTPRGSTGSGGPSSPTSSCTGRAAICRPSPTSTSTKRASSMTWGSIGTGPLAPP